MRKYLLLLTIISLISFLIACNTTNPKNSFEKYIKGWEKQDFSSMYNILSKSSKIKYDQATFSKKYQEIYSGISVSKIIVDAKYPKKFKEDKNNTISIPYEATIETPYGIIKFSHNGNFKKEKITKDNKETEAWTMNWDSTMIFPDLSDNENIKVIDSCGKRGELYDRNNKPLAINNPDGTRNYPNNSITGFITGYVAPIKVEDLLKEQYKDYKINEIIGTAGLEYQYESKLKQKTGKEIVIEDSNGNKKKTLLKKAPQNGENIKLSIDLDIQTALNDQLANESGTGIAINPKTGEVLALVNAPSYNPNNPINIPINKFRCSYSPGSTFKVITSAIGLSTGKLDPNENKNIIGQKWQRDGWGNHFVTRAHPYSPPSDLRNALIYSDNIYFAQVALNIGSKSFINEVIKFGIGEKFPFDIPLLKESQIMNKDITSEGQLADTGYGQGEILMNPIHLSTIYTFLSNDGNILKPTLLFKDNSTPEIWKNSVCSKEHADLIKQYLGESVSNPNGTAYKTYIPNIPIAGKTGTAELKATLDVEGSDNGWFIGVDTKNYKLQLCMLIEGVEDKGGSAYVVQKAKNIFSQFCN